MQDILFHFRAPTNSEVELTSRQLLEHSRQATGLSVEHQVFGLLAYKDTNCIGSVIGKVFFNWLHIDLIWVEESHRRQGLGKKLMEHALTKANEMRLSGIEVWTQSWQAPEFYRNLGYEEFATLEDFTPGRKRHAFRHYLSTPSQPACTPSSLPETVRAQVRSYFKMHGEALPSSGIYDRLMPLFEKPLIEVTLEVTGGNQIKAAALLGINRNTLHKKITDLKIDVAKITKKTA